MTGLAGHDASYLHAVWLVASAVAVAVIVAGVVIYRRARRAARLEEIERIIAEHDALE